MFCTAQALKTSSLNSQALRIFNNTTLYFPCYVLPWEWNGSPAPISISMALQASKYGGLWAHPQRRMCWRGCAHLQTWCKPTAQQSRNHWADAISTEQNSEGGKGQIMCCFLVSYDAVMKYLPNVPRENSVYANNVPLLFRSDCVHHNFCKGPNRKNTHKNKTTKTTKPATQWSWRCLGKFLLLL